MRLPEWEAPLSPHACPIGAAAGSDPHTATAFVCSEGAARPPDRRPACRRLWDRSPAWSAADEPNPSPGRADSRRMRMCLAFSWRNRTRHKAKYRTPCPGCSLSSKQPGTLGTWQANHEDRLNHEDRKDLEGTFCSLRSCISRFRFCRGNPGRRVRALLLSQHFKDVPGQRFFNLGVAWNRLAHSGFGILVPVVSFAGADEGASLLLDSADQIAALHESRSSATLRTSGMAPLVSSS